ncbi:right-handed parallel beta-helix repeat-containing protein [Streptomyces iconiensis]|uniref:Right-handed parallel beta-helix repeat-containing protein n=1 Tax=Streptomyces iconiensis TaxID=1384038 RepID=A0ABT6ZP94_9ACTN|nr:right-handed parallel beta-helix repeat-containing protein [Streptomyces iconiensis]MDJ1130882.1 right-handed parallel beta-helix repeat-containing protein [Streptomyces iconiensis]
MRAPSLLSAAVAAAGLTALVATALPASTAQAAPSPRTLHASPEGTGARCTAGRPCSLEGARDRARKDIADGMDRDLRIQLAGGVYERTEPLRLDARDSGRDGHTVRWTAAPGAKPVLSGGRRITGWQAGEGGTWQASVPEGVTPRQLFVDGQRATRARGAACAADVCDAGKDGMTGARASGVADWKRPTEAEAVIRVRWRNYHCRITGVEGDTLTFARPCWTNSASGTGRTGPAWDTTTVDSAKYQGVSWFENAPELLDKPGEFTWDAQDRTVTYLPRKGERMDEAETVTPRTEQLAVLDGTHHVALTGIGFQYAAYHQPNTDEGYAGTQAGLTLTGAEGPQDQAGRHYTKPSAALTVRGGRHLTVDRADFTHLGGAGIVLERGTKDSTVTRSSLTDLSSGALYIGDTEPRPEPGLRGERNTVAYNTIRETGREYTDAVGIWAGYEAGLTVDHNTLDRLPYSGISVGWGWNQPEVRKSVLRDNRITHNRITDVMRVKDGQHDGGAIYTQGAQHGSTISGNYINRSAYGNTERDGNGIYLDEQSSHLKVEKNVLTRLGYKWVSNWAGYGIDNHATGNWTDTPAPALGGEGSTMTGNHTGLDRLPAAALKVAARAGAAPGGEVEQLRPDLARGATATQSSTEGEAGAARALDGDTNTDTATLEEKGAWWQADLGARRRLGQIEVWNGASTATADFDVLLSDNPAFTGATRIPVTGAALRPTLLETEGATARYIRIELRGSGKVALSSVLAHPDKRNG